MREFSIALHASRITRHYTMNPIGLFYGSTNGTTAQIANRIQHEFESVHHQRVELFDVAEFYLEEMLEFDRLIFGIPTWNHGQLQRDWETVFEEFDQLDLQGKRVAIFGVGDQVGYPTTFGDAVFILADKVRERKATLVGSWPIQHYLFQNSWAVEGDHLLGLLLDEDNQPELSNARITAWVEQLIVEFGEVMTEYE